MPQRRTQSRRRRRGASRRPASASAKGRQLAIPYEHTATFELRGRPGNLLQDVINISVEGVFVATAIGYGLEEERGRPTDATQGLGAAALANPFDPGTVTLSQFPTESLISGVRVNPDFRPMVFRSTSADPEDFAPQNLQLAGQQLPEEYRGRIFQRLRPPSDVSFLFSMVDTASGRELQDEPAHNLASLGKSNGERPFRSLARPLSFQPRSTIRMQVTELSEGTRGRLYITLFGFKFLDLASCPESMMRRLTAMQNGAAAKVSPTGGRVIPFDYVATFQLTGNPQNAVTDEIPINVDGGFVATSVGYGLATDSADGQLIPLGLDETANPQTDLAALQLDQLPIEALIDGFRIRPEFLRVALQPGGQLANVATSLANRTLESLNRPADVSFRYSILDTATGREMQSRPINNVAGLGIADGDRPFKKLARPMVFLPRSTIRVRVEEHFGRGRLFIVFQGYKVLG